MYRTTFQLPSGNRFVPAVCDDDDDSLTMRNSSNTAPLNNVEWMVAGPNGTFFATTGNILYEINSDTKVNEIGPVDASSRPLVIVDDADIPIAAPFRNSIFSAPVPIMASNNVQGGGDLLYINEDQELIQQKDGEEFVVVANVGRGLIDGGIVYSENRKMWALYTDPTNQRYVHNVLGDPFEGRSLTVLKQEETNGLIEVEFRIELPETDDSVYEGLAPVWADLDGDGGDDLITTVARSGGGAQIRAYLLSTQENTSFVNYTTAESEYIGQSNRWRHVLGVVQGVIWEVQTPHLGGRVQLYKLVTSGENNGNLIRQKRLAGEFTSHNLFSRNLDMAALYDLNQNGIPELIIQVQNKRALVGLEEENGVVWTFPLPSPLSSNIAVGCDSLAFGTENGGAFVLTTMSSQEFATSGTRASSTLLFWLIFAFCCHRSLFRL